MLDADIQIIPHAQAIDIPTIIQLLNMPEAELAHGETLTGKPSTRIHLNQDYILKVQRNLKFASQSLAQAWASKQFEKEQHTQLYHPSKTWFTMPTAQGWTAANISCRLSPINTIIDTTTDEAQKLHYLVCIADIYLAHAGKYHERLDEGLSNFAIDAQQAMYYIDDDFYAWDHLLSFTNMVALWLRLFSSSWLCNHMADELGRMLQQQMEQHFAHHNGVDYPAIFIEHLKRQFFNATSKKAMQEVCKGMLSSTETSQTNIQTKKALSKHDMDHEHVAAWFYQDAPIAIISDVHANLPALEAVFQDIQAQNIQHIVCLGDVVGYGPHPAECIRLLQEKGVFIIRGNHDYMVGSGKDFSHGSTSSLHVARWTTKHIDKAAKKWLATLPLQLRRADLMLVHGAPKDPTFFNAYVYERTAEPNLHWMAEQQLPLCFHGHSHLQGMYTMQHNTLQHHKALTTYPLQANTLHLVCPGAVGQPRSGRAGAEYAIYDPKDQAITFKHLEYDIQRVTQDMKKFQFPEQLITRLEQGF